MIKLYLTMCHENSKIIIQYKMIYIWNKYNHVMRNNITSISLKIYDVWTWAGLPRGDCN